MNKSVTSSFWMRTAFLVSLGLLSLNSVQAQVGIGVNTPDASAMLEVNSSARGLLIPRLTLTQRQAMSSPATGVMIFQTDNTPGFYYNSGTPASPNWQLLLPQNGDGSGLTQLNANAISSGTVNTARLGSGTANSTTYLRGDGTWSAVSGGGSLPTQTGNAGKFLSTNGTSASWSNPSNINAVNVITLTNNGTTTINVNSAHFNTVLLLNFSNIASTTIQVNLPAPSAAISGARFKFSYCAYTSSNWTMFSKTAGGQLYCSNGVFNANVNGASIITSEFYCDGVNWYEITQV